MINSVCDQLFDFFHSPGRQIASTCRTVGRKVACLYSKKVMLADFEVDNYLFKIYEKSQAEGFVKNVTELQALLYPPNYEALPADWEKIVAKIPKAEGLLQLEGEEERLVASKILSFNEVLSEFNWNQVDPAHSEIPLSVHPEISLSAEAIRKRFIQINPLFAKAWELAGNPAIEEATEDFATNSHLSGWAAFYAPSTHTICLPKSALNGQKLWGLVFETMNAIQRKSFEMLERQDLSREEHAICGEYIEWNSYVWRQKILCPKDRLINFHEDWKSCNIPASGLFVSHADTHRLRWDKHFSGSYAFRHPDVIQNRVEELSRLGKICKLDPIVES